MKNFNDIDCNDEADRFEVDYDDQDESPFAGLILGATFAAAFWAVVGFIVCRLLK